MGNINKILWTIVRWLIGIAILPLLLYAVFLYVMYPFEMVIMRTSNLNFIYHLVIVIVFVALMNTSGNVIIGGILGMIIKIVPYARGYGRGIYLALFSIGVLIIIGTSLYVVWFGGERMWFSWQLLPYRIFNQISFSLLVLNLVLLIIVTVSSGVSDLRE